MDEQNALLYLSCIDFDVAGFYEAFRAKIGALADGLPVQRTGGGGHQIFFLSTLKIRNEKLAWAPNEKEETGREIAIETRGEGGYAVLAPSIHPSGNRYQWLSGDVENVPVVSESDGLALMAAARSLDQAPQTRQDAGKQAGPHGKAQPSAGAQNAKAEGSKAEGADSEPGNFGDSDDSGEESQPTDKAAEKKRRTATVRNQIIDAFNAAHSIEQMLEKHGYSRVEGRFARPGGTSPSVHIADGKSYHHSSNDPLCDGFHHSGFDLFKRLEHGDDFRAAIKAAAEELGLDWTGAFTAPQHRQFEKERQRRDLRGSFDAQAQERDVPLIAANERQLKDKLVDLRAAIERANQKKPRLFRGPDGIVLVEAGQGLEPVLSRPSSYAMQAIASEVAFWFGTTQSGVPIEVDPPRELVV